MKTVRHPLPHLPGSHGRVGRTTPSARANATPMRFQGRFAGSIHREAGDWHAPLGKIKPADALRRPRHRHSGRAEIRRRARRGAHGERRPRPTCPLAETIRRTALKTPQNSKGGQPLRLALTAPPFLARARPRAPRARRPASRRRSTPTNSTRMRAAGRKLKRRDGVRLNDNRTISER